MTKNNIFEQILQDERGRVIGKARTYRRPLTKAEREACERFLRGVTRVRDDDTKGAIDMSKRDTSKTVTKEKESDRCNIVYLAGEIKKLSVRDEDAFLLLDTGPEKKFIQCTVYKERQLIELLGRFEEGDQIKVVGFVRPWGQKVEGEWKNHMDIRITQIKSTPPQRESARSRREIPPDDDIPF